MRTQRNPETSLGNLYRRIMRKDLILPPHQRASVWEEHKRNRWFEDIRETASRRGTVSGLVTAYRLKEEDEETTVQKINDGAQRIYFSLPKFKETFASEEDFMETIDNVFILVQEVVYDDITEAIEQFYILNKGTIATPYELIRGIYVANLEDYEATWETIIESIHKIVDRAIDRLGIKKGKEGRETSHKRLRENFVLFYIFSSENPERTSYQASKGEIKNWVKDTRIETWISNKFNELKSEQAIHLIKKFELFVDKAAAFYSQIWAENMSPNLAPYSTHFRWWVEAYAILLREGYKTSTIREFTECYIVSTRGKTTIYTRNEPGEITHLNIGVGDLSKLTRVCELLEISLERKDSRNRSTPTLKAGFTQSHIKAFGVSGEGETLIENAVENEARVNRDMTPVEEERLRKIAASPKKETRMIL